MGQGRAGFCIDFRPTKIQYKIFKRNKIKLLNFHDRNHTHRSGMEKKGNFVAGEQVEMHALVIMI